MLLCFYVNLRCCTTTELLHRLSLHENSDWRHGFTAAWQSGRAAGATHVQISWISAWIPSEVTRTFFFDLPIWDSNSSSFSCRSFSSQRGPTVVGSMNALVRQLAPNMWRRAFDRVGQSREIYSNSVPLSPPHWPCPKRIRPPSWPRVAVASSIQNTKLFTWRTWPGAGAVPKYDWAARSQCGSKQRRADHTKYIWYVATHGQSVITTELMIAWIW